MDLLPHFGPQVVVFCAFTLLRQVCLPGEHPDLRVRAVVVEVGVLLNLGEDGTSRKNVEPGKSELQKDVSIVSVVNRLSNGWL